MNTAQPQVNFVYNEAGEVDLTYIELSIHISPFNLSVVDSIRTWLRPPHPKPTNYDKKSKLGSCKWFIGGQQFEAWKASKRGVYWVHGNGTLKVFLSRSDC